jgi:hypothetical protein
MRTTPQPSSRTARLFPLRRGANVLAGVMGMNFKVGIFHNASLFWVVIAVIIAVAPHHTWNRQVPKLDLSLHDGSKLSKRLGEVRHLVGG